MSSPEIQAAEAKVTAAQAAIDSYTVEQNQLKANYQSANSNYIALQSKLAAGDSSVTQGSVDAAKAASTSAADAALATKGPMRALIADYNDAVLDLSDAQKKTESPAAPSTPPPPVDSEIDGAPSDEQKQNELVSKVSSSGNISDFKKVTVADGDDNVMATVNTLTAQAQSATQSASPLQLDGGNGDVVYTTGDCMVRITSTVNPDDEVLLKVSPTIAENRSAAYSATDILHHPGAMQVYRSTSARTYGVTAILVSRTAEEAQDNLDAVNLIRSWVMPYYGAGTEADEKDGASGSRFGAPPDVLTLSAYGPSMIGPVPVVLTTYNMTWPNEVTYIKATNGNPFPVVLNLTIDFVESYSPKEYSNFTLSSYKEGDLVNAFPVISKVAGR